MGSPMFTQAPGGAIRPLGFRATGRGAPLVAIKTARLAPRADEEIFIGSGVSDQIVEVDVERACERAQRLD